ncbi:PKD domain-containing protein [Patulibacter sp. NPDC049589]|uniref:PKD domain-containing protein n=1 Tax=Patulibacter sp. NPDC049589 TaxID=3154731 RepID=UPI003445E53A
MSAAAGLALLAAPALVAAPAHAATDLSKYGELHRFGGFDTARYAENAYTGALTAGKLVDPVGFTVDPQDGGTATAPTQAVWVLDRTNIAAVQQFRLQKLSQTGEVLGTTTFSVPKDADGNNRTIVGLAVDHTTGSAGAGAVYAVIERNTAGSNGTIGRAEEVVGWSTAPQDGKLVAAAGLNPVGAALLAPGAGFGAPGALGAASTLAAAGNETFAVQGLAVHTRPGGARALALASALTGELVSGDYAQGAVVQDFALTGTRGARLGRWTSDALAGLPDASGHESTSQGAAGLQALPDGSGALALVLSGNIESAEIVRLDADLANPKILLSNARTDYPVLWAAQGGTIGLPARGTVPEYGNTPSTAGGAGNLTVATSTGAWAAAADPYTYGGGSGDTSNRPLTQQGVAFVDPLASGALATPIPPVTTVAGTLASATKTGPCAFAGNGLTFAAGAGGSVWVLSRSQSSVFPSGGDYPTTSGREIVELGPGGTACSERPSGTFTVQGGTTTARTPASDSDPLIVPTGTKVTFDTAYDATDPAKPLGVSYGPDAELAGVVAPRFGKRELGAWDLDGDATNGAAGDGYEVTGARPNDGQIKASSFVPDATFTYTTPGVFPVRLRILGESGPYVKSGSVVVQAAQAPTASFTVAGGATAGKAVAFDGSGSTTALGTTLKSYRWDWGDGSAPETTSTAQASHVYGAAGSFTAKLRVTNNTFQNSTEVTRSVSVAPKPVDQQQPPTQTTTQTTPTTTVPTTQLPPPGLKPTLVAKFALSIAKPKAVKRGKSLSFKVTVRNSGTAGSAASVLTVTPPKGVRVGSGKAGKAVKVKVAAIKAGGSKVITVKLKTAKSTKTSTKIKLSLAGGGLKASGTLSLKLK